MPGRLRRDKRSHFIVCGDTPLARRIVEELVSRLGEEVTVILPSKRRNHGPQIAKLPGVRIVESADLSVEAFVDAGIATARALALVAQDDVGNIHAALRATELNPDIRLVIRIFNMDLGHQIRTLFADCAVLSDAVMAAPWFVAAGLGELAPNHVRLPGRTLYVARREQVPAARAVCGIADTEHSGVPRLLPPGQAGGDLVLAVADGTPLEMATVHPTWYRVLGRKALGVLDTLRVLVNKQLGIAFLGLLGLLVVSTGLFAMPGHIPWADAVYLTLLDAAGAAQPDTGLSGINKVTQVIVTIVGIALIPVVTAAVVDAVVGARLSSTLGRVRRMRDHVIVVGLGNVGARVMSQLRDLGVPVVGVERNQDASGVALARRLGVPVVFADASREETLRSAWVETSRAMVAVTSDDVTNLQAALNARSVRDDLRVVLRLFDGDLAERVQHNFGIGISRSVSYLAAPAFAAAMVERQVIGTIAVGRRALLIAELPVTATSALVGRTLDSINDTEVRAIAVSHGTRNLDWSPDPRYQLAEGNRVLIVATRVGLADTLNQSMAGSDESAS
ncbi:TrkA family potassium uptake protein [Solihabitans fulvus]|uniref:TrkA family potassium uptake protein n=1 Tax=Solihabitans fulvus TaxID=1892852 RepID=A0A5B2WL91_9PSEU|nr:NAD-binding protein [Solihabitans fulvus]KAA2252561.1 TrkA family potassium uptake protein [Solihabitans fulvus]